MTLPEIYGGQVISRELLYIIKRRITDAPRSQQRMIGPSELGMPCTRRLIHKLADHDDPIGRPKWLATVGTAVHEWLADAIAHCDEQKATVQPRFLVEQRVDVGEINGIPVKGSADLFDIDAGMVIDWKIVGTSRLQHYKRHGPGEQYRRQVHLYGRGMVRAGHHCNSVMIAFLPRNADLSESYFWCEAYDEQVALDTLARVQSLHTLVQTFGADQVLAMYPQCDDHWCPWCRQLPPPRTLKELTERESP